MKRIEVRESKIPLIVGILDFIVFFIFLVCFSIASLSDNAFVAAIFCIMIFGGFCFLGIYLIISYFRRRLILYDNYFTYTKTLGKTKTYEYYEISSIQTMFNTVNIQLKIYNKNDKKIVSIENNMLGYEQAIDFFLEKNINIDNADIEKYGNKIDKIRKKNDDNKKNEENYIKNRWTIQQIKKEIQFMKIFNIIIIVCFVMSLFLPIKTDFMINLIIIVFIYCLYLHFYPKMVLEIKDKSKSYRIPFPFLCFCLIMLHFLFSTETINEKGNMIFLYSLIFSIIIFIPFILNCLIKKIKTYKLKTIIIFILIFTTSFSVVRPINYILTFKTPTHETVTIIDKYSNRNRKSGRSYYFKIILNNEKTDVEVSKNIYNKKEINDNVQICNKESILGYKYFTIHE